MLSSDAAIGPLTCQGKPLVQEVPGCLSALGCHLILYVLDDDGEGEHEDAHEKEEAIGDHVGQRHLVRHGVSLLSGVSGSHATGGSAAASRLFPFSLAEPDEFRRLGSKASR